MLLTTAIQLLAALSLAERALGAAIQRRDCSFDPSNSGVNAGCAGDAPYDISEATLAANIFCVNGMNNVKKPYLLVPGTGSDGPSSWQHTYGVLVGARGLGYDPCWISPPPLMLADIQDNAQYIAYAAGYLSSLAGGAQLVIQGWSQGNLASQWALTFWPSIRPKIRQFISLAGDFKGTTIAPLVDLAALGMISPSVQQQTVELDGSPSTFLRNLALKSGNKAWVPTTSIFSLVDDVIQPEPNNELATSWLLPGRAAVSNIQVQAYCPGLVYLHETHLFATFTYNIVVAALSAPSGVAPTGSALRKVLPPCLTALLPPPLIGLQGVAATEVAIVSAAAAIANPLYFSQGVDEPPAKPYVAGWPNA